MYELLRYLHSPHLVASFQRLFGIESLTADKHQKHQQQQKQQQEQYHETPPKNNGIKHDHNDKQMQQPSSSPKKKKLVNSTDDSNNAAPAIIHTRFWFYLFHLGAAMGNEIFYSLFFPVWFWNIDGVIARKVAILWGTFMYVGQATKDIVCLPRPASPPVVKLEERYRLEHGMPSTHAMVAAGLPISMVVLSHARYNIDLTASVLAATLFCCWVCASRLYLGMHSLLDVIAGVLYSTLILLVAIPALERMDAFLVESAAAPLVAILVGYTVCYCYPALKQWSSARGDTTIIIGTVVGFTIGANLANAFGYLMRPSEPPLYDINFHINYVHCVVRTCLGVAVLVATRQVLKKIVLRALCALYGRDARDPASKREFEIELPYYFFTYLVIGINVSFVSPVLFHKLGIQRDYRYTEL